MTYESAAPAAAASTDSAASPAAPAPATTPSRMPSLATVATLAAWLWLAGVLGMAAWIVRSHLVLRRLLTRCRTQADAGLHRDLAWCVERMGMSRHSTPGLWGVRGLPTVAVHGWLRPTILVPDGLRERFSTEEIRGMFIHELSHVRRGDLIWSHVLLAVCALHWFNPLVWLLARRMRADAELECDRLALESLSHTQRRHYGEALLKTLEFSPACVPAPAVPFFRHAKEIQTRIQMIALPRSSAVARYAALLIVPALAGLTLTTSSPAADRDNPSHVPGEKQKAAADGEQTKTGARDGEVKKEGARDGEMKKTGARDGEGAAKGPRDGEGGKTGARDGEGKKEGARDGEGTAKGPRDGEGSKSGVRDGEMKKTGARDGEGTAKGPRDGEGSKSGARDGEGAPKKGARDGESAAAAGSPGETVVLRVTDKGEKVTIGSETIAVGSLRGYLSRQAAGMTVSVQGDDDVPAAAMAEVVDAVRDNRIKMVKSASRGADGEGKARSAGKEER